jgi:hypothetical protein
VNKNGRHSVMLIIALRIFLFAVGWPRGTRCPIKAGYTCRLLNRRPRALYTYVYTRQWAYTPVRHATHQNWAQHGQPRHRQANARVLNLTEGRRRQILTSMQRSQSAFSWLRLKGPAAFWLLSGCLHSCRLWKDIGLLSWLLMYT